MGEACVRGGRACPQTTSDAAVLQAPPPGRRGAGGESGTADDGARPRHGGSPPRPTVVPTLRGGGGVASDEVREGLPGRSGWCVGATRLVRRFLFFPSHHGGRPSAAAGARRLGRRGGGVCAAVGASGCHPLAIRDCRGWPISGGKPAGGRRRRTGHGNVSAGRRAGRCLPYQSHTPACGRLAGERVSPSRSLLFSFFDPQPSLTLTGCASQRWGGTREVQRTGRASVSWTGCCERRDALRV